MEAIQCTDNGTEAVVEIQEKPETSRILKRNIEELAVDGKINEEIRSPARKEVKFCHETYLRKELEQWKALMNEDGIRQSVIYRDNLNVGEENFVDILKQDQKEFINDAIDIRKTIEASREFRRKFDFFVRVNKLVIQLDSEKAMKALDRGKQQSIHIRMQAKQCGIPPFYSVGN